MGLFERPRRTILPTLRAAQSGDRLVGSETELRKAIADARRGESVTLGGVTYYYPPYEIVIAASIGLTETVVLPSDILGLTIRGRRGVPVYAESSGYDLFRIEGLYQALIGILNSDVRDGAVEADAFVLLSSDTAVSNALISGCNVSNCLTLVESSSTVVSTTVSDCTHTPPSSPVNTVSLSGTVSGFTFRDCMNIGGSLSFTGITLNSTITNSHLIIGNITISNATSTRNLITGNIVSGNVDTSSSFGGNYIGGNAIIGTLSEAATDIVNTGDASGAYNL